MALSAEQLELRRSGIGGSEIAAIVGASPWSSPRRVWKAKREGDTFEGNNATRAGNRLEAVVLDWYGEEVDEVVYPPSIVWPDSVGGSLRHPKEPWALATPDGVIVDSAGPARLVEAKAVGLHQADAWSDGVPDYYVVQVLWQMHVSGIEEADVAVIIGGQDFRRYAVAYDSKRIAELAEAARIFWHEHVLAGVEPPVSANDCDAEDLDALFPTNVSNIKDAPAGARALVDAYEAASAEEDAAKEKKKLARNRLVELIGDAEGILGSDFKVTYKSQRGQPHWKTIAGLLNAPAALIADHTPEMRVMRVTTKKAGAK